MAKSSADGKTVEKKPKTIVLQLANQKGGVAKTTSAWNISKELARRGYRTLMVDIDAQASLTVTWFKFETHDELQDQKTTLFNVLSDYMLLQKSPKALASRPAHTINSIMDMVTPPNLYAVASNIRLASMDTEQGIGREMVLKNVLEPEMGKWDFIILDSPPNLGLMFVNGLVAADYVLIPMQAEFYSMVGLDMLFMTIETTKRSKLSSAEVLGIFITQFEQQTRISRKSLKVLQDGEGQSTPIFKQAIRKGTVIKEAADEGKAVFEKDPNHPVAEDYGNFVNEVLQKLEAKEGVEIKPQFKK